jgi:hypothetical protein
MSKLNVITAILFASALLIGLVIAEVGVPSTTLGWCLLVAFGPIGFVLANGLSEWGMGRLEAKAPRSKLGPFARFTLLLVLALLITALGLYFKLA